MSVSNITSRTTKRIPYNEAFGKFSDNSCEKNERNNPYCCVLFNNRQTTITKDKY